MIHGKTFSDDAHLRGLGERGVLGALGRRAPRRLPQEGDAERRGLHRGPRVDRGDEAVRGDVAHQGNLGRPPDGEEEGGGERRPAEKGGLTLKQNYTRYGL